MADRRRQLADWAVPIVLVLILWAYAFPALRSYNVTWDEALGDLFFGQRYTSYWTSFDPAYLDFEADPYPADHRPDLRASPFRTRPWEHYPVGATLGAAASALFWRGLGVFDPFDGYHAANVVLAGLLVLVLVPFLRRRFSLTAAIATVVTLFSAPRVFAHMMANIKDFPLMIFFTLGLVAFLVAYERGSVKGLLGAGALWGVALATKANALFWPAIPAAVVAIDLLRRQLPEVWHGNRRRLVLGIGAASLLGPLMMVALWPYLWADPIARLGENLAFVAFRRGTTRAESMAPVLEALVLTTPLSLLILAAIGGARAFVLARRGHRAAILLLVWIPGVLGRYLLPSAVNYDGVRHFLEIFPALAALAGIGVAWLVEALVALLGRRRVTLRPQLLGGLLAATLLLPSVTTLLRAHPFELAYWNRLAGGLAGARARGLPQAGDYWGASYRLGIEWLNEHAPRGALIAVPVIEHAVRLVAPIRLRGDLELVPLTSPFRPQIDPQRLAAFDQLAQQRMVFVMFVDRKDWTNQLMEFCQRHLTPEVSWIQDNAPVLRIYRYGQGWAPTSGMPSPEALSLEALSPGAPPQDPPPRVGVPG